MEIERELELEDHNQKVEKIKQFLKSHKLPILPLTCVRLMGFYERADIITKINEHFIVIDYINSKGQLGFDIGGLAMIANSKDIVECCIALIDNLLWQGATGKTLENIRVYDNNKYPKFKILREEEFKEYIVELVNNSELCKQLTLI